MERSEEKKEEHALLTDVDSSVTKSKIQIYLDRYDSETRKHQHVIENEWEFEDDEVDHVDDQLIISKKGCCPTTSQDKLMTIIYIVLILVVMVMTVLYFIDGDIFEEFLSLIIVVITTWVGVIIAMIAIYYGANVRDQSNELNTANKQYKNQINDLKKVRREIVREIKKSRNNVRELTAEGEILNESVTRFSGLISEFDKLRRDWSELDDIFGQLTDTQDILQRMRNQNERAKLFAFFYDADQSHTAPGLTKEEYETFLDKIPKRYRIEFEKFDFEALDINQDNNIDQREFEAAVQKVLNNIK